MLKNSSSPDPRARRTRWLLQEALQTLVRERGFEAITVQDITRQAAVNRATFYLHYEDKYDLLTQTMREVIEAPAREYAQFFESGEVTTPDRTPELFVRMFERYGQHADLLRRLLGRHGDARFAAQLHDMIEKSIREARVKFAPAPGPDQPPVTITTQYLAGALLGLLIWWLEHNQPYSAAAMAAWYWSLLWTPAMTVAPAREPAFA
ncbi:MAG: TetR/AcrR family transcriptional regulator [Anaerolineales bacterium]|nr:TetR/AcrR family transcriptional regulator [Anaerolineales bacterium]